uniref:Uncharacterized protein n=1 Tax=viral metagenome TaxID=1070528 RepID=A0A6M3L318_9ZZZZ
MKHWTYCVIEAHCFGDEDENGNNPCGRNVPSPFCLGNGSTKHCPHFAWTSDATERDAAFFVPLRKIVWDKLRAWIVQDVGWWFEYWFFRKWKPYDDSWLDEIKVIADDDPIMQKWHEEDRKQQLKFEKWFPKAKKEW